MFPTIRRSLTRPIHKWARTALPQLSETEREAMNAGEIWWEGELFSGNPDWAQLRSVEKPELTKEEEAFIDGPCQDFCRMIDDWKINNETADLPTEAWEFLREHRFFGMIIPKKHGGLGFSAYAHSEVLRLLSSRSVAAAVTVMVPNSLGPGELLLQFGTEEQQDYWLPRLANGRELPAFGLTSEEAGSDASAMTDSGVVCRGTWNDEEVIGIRLNFAKRYITLAPVCTVLGLAFKLSDPDGLLGGREDLGFTCALVPADLPGVLRGHRHIPGATMFQNGPISGEDVFIPVDSIIGGPDQAGQGWRMLMSALAAGRGISLPSLSAAATALAAHTTGAYARIREQFGIPIGKFGGVQAPMAQLAASAYTLDAARHLTCAGLDEGRSLSLISAIMKAHATYRMRDALQYAMDVHSGKAVIDGPLNYLSPLYNATPIGITVEGANIVTRSLIIFGQGSVRAHPHMLDEMLALSDVDDDASLNEFSRHFWRHIGHTLATTGRAVARAWTGARSAPTPSAGAVTDYYAQMGRWSAAFALVADMAFLTLGGALKRNELISARMGDVLSDLYFLSAVLKRWEDEGRQKADLPVVHYAAQDALSHIQTSLDEVLINFPNRAVSGVLRVMIRSKACVHGPNDRLTKQCAELMMETSATRERIVGKLYEGCDRDGVELINLAFAKVVEAEPIRKRLREANQSPEDGLRAGTISQDERDQLTEMDKAVQAVVAVDDFAPGELARLFPGYEHDTRTSKESAQ
ncbi:MAG: acyl-CoA dehydrogenase [Rhodobacteraceae bacterium]|uniref:acyl-CoA dehydrogenase n=1 Tax=Marivita sp. TaxID=2003365 RepID=UPI003B52FFF2|nr:acyl-CoA dehydrogenase [Paracoccaceae bacterium]